MASSIDPTKPAEGNAYTADVRQNFSIAASEISALQDAAPASSGQITIGTAPNSIMISCGVGAPGGATQGFDQNGSIYADTQGAQGAILYASLGDGTWVPFA